ncbi:hypothetical protein MKW98_018960 [Papaver atlanticum]|uniref:Amidase domain-containing protein n=1 Tax=Papaver atlanticum TaxID=357466 RepID=A0AAD4XXY0_9MAGN|nr:hypothetical protein MKW98_018960 [Papaver atlanticum]
MNINSYLLFLLLALTCNISAGLIQNSHGFSIKEATIKDIQQAFEDKTLTSRKLVEFYIQKIEALNPLLKAVIEVNPDVLDQADQADKERSKGGSFSGMHGIPILIKDNIATKDKLNTSCGSYALVGSVVPRDAGVVAKLRKSGALIMGKASMTEWGAVRAPKLPSGWCAVSGQGRNPYYLSGNPCGSSSGSAIAVTGNLIIVSLGTETDGSILCPCSHNSVCGIKPTLGLCSRSGMIPIAPSLDTVGPIGKTVTDAVYVLDEIVGYDEFDSEATNRSKDFIPKDGYKQFLKKDGLAGKRIGIVRNPFYTFPTGSPLHKLFADHIETMKKAGAVIVDKLNIPNVNTVLNPALTGETQVEKFEFKAALNAYLEGLISSPVRSLAEVIAFNTKNPSLEKTPTYGQDMLVAAERTSGKIGAAEIKVLEKMKKIDKDGFVTLMEKNNLDAVVTPASQFSTVLAIGGHPGISVPAGYHPNGMPIGITFGGLRGSEPKLIEISYAFEQLTLARKPPFYQMLTKSQYATTHEEGITGSSSDSLIEMITSSN